MANNIKQISYGGQTYEIEALHFFAQSNLDSPSQWKKYIDDAVATAAKITLVIDTGTGADNHPSTTASADTLGKIYLVAAGSPEAGTYVEWITVNTSGTTYVWEKIGTTATDLSEYVKYGVSTTSGAASGNTGASSGNTGSTSDVERTTSSNGEQNAVGYIASTLTTSSKTDSVKIDKHSYQPAGSIGGSQTVAAHSHTVNKQFGTAIQTVSASGSTTALTGVKASGSATVVTGVTSDGTTAVTKGVSTTKAGFGKASVITGVASNGTATVLTGVKASSSATVATGVTYSTINAVYSIAVDTLTGILSFGSTPVIKTVGASGTITAVTGVGSNGTATVLTGVKASGSRDVVITDIEDSSFDLITAVSEASTVSVLTGVKASGTANAVTGVTSNGTAAVLTGISFTTLDVLTGATLSTAGGHTIYGSNLSFTGTTTTLSHTQTGSNYNTLNTAGHTHEIAQSTFNEVTVKVSNHTHTVTVPGHSHSLNGHTHSLNNHTHSVTFNTPA